MRRETMLKIMAILRDNLDKGLTILNMARTLKIGYRPAYNHAHGLNNEGILKIVSAGRAKLCSLNLKSEKCRALLAESDISRKESLTSKNVKLKGTLDRITKFSGRLISQIYSVVLFGSYAKGTNAKSSDIDLLFIVDDLKDRNLRDEIERECNVIRLNFNLNINPIITDVEELRKMLQSDELNIGKEVREHGIPILGSGFFWRLVA